MKHLAKSTVLAVSLVLAGASSEANADDLTCDADFAYNIEINNDDLSFSAKNQQKVLITSGQELYLDGERQNLTAQQLALLEDYNQQVRKLLPLASGVAEEASAIAIEAVGSVTAALMQDDPKKAKEFMDKVESISTGLKQHISHNHLRPEGVVDYIESSDFEAEFEALIETAVTDFLENNVGEMVAAAMAGNEEKVKAFEQRMEKFGKEMEEKLESRAEALELQAEKLCQLVHNIDGKEGELVKAFSKFDSYQLITE